MTANDTHAWPNELRLHKDRKTLTVTFDGGERYDLAAEYLRVKSPSAEVQGHSAEERKGEIPRIFPPLEKLRS